MTENGDGSEGQSTPKSDKRQTGASDNTAPTAPDLTAHAPQKILVTKSYSGNLGARSGNKANNNSDE